MWVWSAMWTPVLSHIDRTDLQTSKASSHSLHRSIYNKETMSSSLLDSKMMSSVGGAAEEGSDCRWTQSKDRRIQRTSISSNQPRVACPTAGQPLLPGRCFSRTYLIIGLPTAQIDLTMPLISSNVPASLSPCLPWTIICNLEMYNAGIFAKATMATQGLVKNLEAIATKRFRWEDAEMLNFLGHLRNQETCW